MPRLLALALALALLLTACATTESGTTNGQSTGEGDRRASATSSDGGAGAVDGQPAGADAPDRRQAGAGRAGLSWFRPKAATPVTAMHFVAPGRLQVGFSDATVVDVDLSAKAPRVRKVAGAEAPIVAFSTTGRWAVVGTSPVGLIDLDAGEILIQPSQLETLAATAFAEDDVRWYAGVDSGKLHVWSRQKLTAPVKGEDLRAILGREKTDFTAAFASPPAPMIAVGPSRVLFGDEAGQLMSWDVTGQDIDVLMVLEKPLRSVAHNGAFVAVTTEDGRLRMLDVATGHLVRWTAQARGELVALTTTAPYQAVVADRQTLRLIDIASGEARWMADLPEGELCGLSASASDGPVAVCVGGVVGLLANGDGALLSALSLDEGKARWER